MFDWLRGWRKSDEEKRQEAVAAYLDQALPPRGMREFEARLSEDADLQAELDTQRQVKRLLSQLPRLKAPRNFTLDPAVYGRTQPARTGRLYPQLRAATLIAALLFAVSLTLNLWPGGPGRELAAPQTVESVAVLSEPAAEEEAVEVTRVVAETAPEQAADTFDERPVESAESAESESALQTEAVVAEEVVEESEAAEQEMAEVEVEEEAAAPAAEMELAESAGAVEGEEAPDEEPAEETALSPRPTATGLTSRAATPVPTDLASTGELASAATADESAGAAADEVGATGDDLATEQPAGGAVSPLLLLQIFLGAAALLLGMATLVIRRRR